MFLDCREDNAQTQLSERGVFEGLGRKVAFVDYLLELLVAFNIEFLEGLKRDRIILRKGVILKLENFF